MLAIFLSIFLWGKSAQATDIDIMLVYDTTASSWVDSNGGMAAFSEDAINRMNLAMQNSGVGITFRLAHAMAIAYTTTSNSSTPLTNDLYALLGGSGLFASVHAAREAYGADLVAMLVDHGSPYGYVGQGFLLGDWSGNPDYGFTVNAIQSVAISHTLTHEVGHNLGAHHAKSQYSDPGPNDYLDGEYSAGWYFRGTNGTDYHTIMAYNDDGFGGSYDSAPLFSTPLKNYQGTPAGDTRDADNARLLNETKDIVAGYRASMLVPAAPVALAASAIATNGFTANWSSASGATGYRLDVSTSSTFEGYTTGYDDLDAGIATSLTVTGVTLDQPYYYRVRAYNASGVSGYSNVIVVMTNPVERDDAWRVTEIYLGTMGYAPDYEGLDYWVRQIETNPQWNPTTVAQSFFDQPLVQEQYPEGQGYGALIDALYQNIYGRAADDKGYAYWLADLTSGRVQRKQMIIALIEGGWANPEAANDMARFQNRIEVALAFADYQAEQEIRYSDLCASDQAYLRQAGQEVVAQVTATTASRDSAIAAIAWLLAPLL